MIASRMNQVYRMTTVFLAVWMLLPALAPSNNVAWGVPPTPGSCMLSGKPCGQLFGVCVPTTLPDLAARGILSHKLIPATPVTHCHNDWVDPTIRCAEDPNYYSVHCATYLEYDNALCLGDPVSVWEDYRGVAATGSTHCPGE